ncbi:MAG: LysM peptidoglycan-binding domain-containing protein [Anaerolinea sp.]|nr:LysM peptidoglycan-binding domain-containing protein [Anaerolinea sp.]
MRRVLFLVVLACLMAAVAVPSVVINAQQPQQQPVYHTVQRGENLFRISLRYGVTVSAIQQANRLSNPNLIYVGQVLLIPAPGTVPVPPTATTSTPVPVPTQPAGQVVEYIVKPGDWLAKIARDFKTTVAAIAQENKITNVNLIYVGQKLRIPVGTGVVVPVPTTPPVVVNPPPTGGSSFELGGQVTGLNPNTEAVLRSAKMAWVKFQIQVNDGNAQAILQNAKALGFKVFFGVVGDKNQVLNAQYQDSYAAYVGNLARAGADAIQVWNEMNIDREWPTGQINAALYVQLLQKAYAAIKAGNPATLVITGAPAPTGAEGAFGRARVQNDDTYYADLARAGAANFADCIGVHYNEGVVPATQTSGDPRDNYPTRYLPTMLNRALASFPGKSACFSELGYVSPEGYGPLPAGFAWGANTTAQQQAQYLGQAVAFLRSTGRVRLMIIFNIDFTRYDQEDPQAGYAIIRPGNVCIACATLSAAMP